MIPAAVDAVVEGEVDVSGEQVADPVPAHQVQKPAARRFVDVVVVTQRGFSRILQVQWQMQEQEPGVWRRVVPSPTPLYIFNGKSIKHLVDFGTIVIAGGGGGIPAYNLDDGTLEGLDGVIDKDMTAALLARIIKAQEMFIITDVDNIYLNFKQESQEVIWETNAKDMETWLNEGHFWRGSMEPKIKAALYFLKYHGKEVIITSIENIENAIQKQAGTRILKS